MEPMEIKDDVNNVNERFTFRERIVLPSIISLSLLRGISMYIDGFRYFSNVPTGHHSDAIEYYYIMQTLSAVPGVILLTLITQIHGRRPVFILLFILGLLTAILNCVPYHRPWHIMGNFIAASLNGGALSISAIAICEYSNPKHRFAYLVANELVYIVGARVTGLLLNGGITINESPYISTFLVIVALAGLISVYWWPESPYWLAGQYRYEESKVSLLYLRREGEALKEIQSLENTRRRPTPKLFFLALIIAILTVSVAKCLFSGRLFFVKINDDIGMTVSFSHSIIAFFVGLTLTLVIVLVSYKVKRKIILLGVTIGTILQFYVVDIWVYSGTDKVQHPLALYIIMLICITCVEFGGNSISLALCFEFLPQKYNTIVSCLSTSYYFVSNYLFSFRAINSHYWSVQSFIFLFATIALVAVIILYWLLPEIQDKNLVEIENEYLNKYCDNTSEAEDVCHSCLTLMCF